MPMKNQRPNQQLVNTEPHWTNIGILTTVLTVLSIYLWSVSLADGLTLFEGLLGFVAGITTAQLPFLRRNRETDQ